MRVVLDTSVLLSAFISPHGSPVTIYRAWHAARFEIVTLMSQPDELRRASRYPKSSRRYSSRTASARW